MSASENIRASIAQFLNKPQAEIQDTAVLKNLVTDSFMLVELVMTLQEDYKVRVVQDDLQHVATVGDLIGVFTKLVEAKT